MSRAASRPDRRCRRSTFAVATPPSWPGYHISRMDLTLPAHGMKTASPVLSTTTVFGFAAVTCEMRVFWNPASDEPVRDRVAAPVAAFRAVVVGEDDDLLRRGRPSAIASSIACCWNVRRRGRRPLEAQAQRARAVGDGPQLDVAGVPARDVRAGAAGVDVLLGAAWVVALARLAAAVEARRGCRGHVGHAVGARRIGRERSRACVELDRAVARARGHVCVADPEHPRPAGGRGGDLAGPAPGRCPA